MERRGVNRLLRKHHTLKRCGNSDVFHFPTVSNGNIEMVCPRPHYSAPERAWRDRVYTRRYALDGTQYFQGGPQSYIEEADIIHAGNNGSETTEGAQFLK